MRSGQAERSRLEVGGCTSTVSNPLNPLLTPLLMLYVPLDERHPAPLGRICDPDDIIGTVLVEDGRVKADTYQAMPSYRVYTPVSSLFH